MTFDEFMRKWATECQNNAALAIISLPFIVVISIMFALYLFLKGDKKYKECL